jgi:hypothetical protein
MPNHLHVRVSARANSSIPQLLALATSGGAASGPNATDSHGGRAVGLGAKRRGRSAHHVHSDDQRGIERCALARPLECRVVQRA